MFYDITTLGIHKVNYTNQPIIFMSLEILTRELLGANHETDAYIIAEQTPTDKICPTACPSCRTFEQVGGKESEYLASLEKAFEMASYQKSTGASIDKVINYMTAKQKPKMEPTIPYLMELGKKYNLNLEVIILIQMLSKPDKKSLEKSANNGLKINGIELSDSEFQKGGEYGLYVQEVLGAEASLSMIRNTNGTINGYENLGLITDTLLTEILPEIISKKYKFDPSKILVRGLVDTNGVPLNESVAVVDPDKLISNPDSILPIGVYKELKNLPSMRADVLIDDYGHFRDSDFM
jgi:hypothetical protein